MALGSYYGSGTLNITAGGVVTSADGDIGSSSVYSTAAATVAGAGSTWTNGYALFVNGRTGTLTIADGGTVSDVLGTIDSYGSPGATVVTVSGAGSTWTNSQSIWVGSSQSGVLNITDGGEVTSSSSSNGYVNSFIGDKSGSTGVVTVIGSGSTWTNGHEPLYWPLWHRDAKHPWRRRCDNHGGRLDLQQSFPVTIEHWQRQFPTVVRSTTTARSA